MPIDLSTIVILLTNMDNYLTISVNFLTTSDIVIYISFSLFSRQMSFYSFFSHIAIMDNFFPGFL